MSKVIRIGIAGAGRGRSFQTSLKAFGGAAELTAICDIDEQLLSQWSQGDSKVATYHDFDRMLADDVCDAVVIATPMQIHARQSIAALRAGKHVLCEVPACLSDREGRDLISAAKASSATYMMAENYCFSRAHMVVEEMVNRGVFGELSYVEGMYVHDCRSLFFKPDGSLTWRGEVHGKVAGNTYPTHSFGPIARWLGIGKQDAMESVYAISTPAVGLADFARRMYGDDHPGAKPGAWAHGDSAACLVKTRLGRVVMLRLDIASSRPHHMSIHELQGTRAVHRKTHGHRDMGLIWIEGRSPGVVLPPSEKMGVYYEAGAEWEPISKYADEFEHALWRQWGPKAAESGHGGGDLIITAEFIRAIQERVRPSIDVYDAVTWSSIVWLSAESERTGQAVAAIDYTSL
jgi:predicted dehydrogenase